MTKYTIKELEWNSFRKVSIDGIDHLMYCSDLVGISYTILQNTKTKKIKWESFVNGAFHGGHNFKYFDSVKQACQKHFKEFMRKGLVEVNKS